MKRAAAPGVNPLNGRGHDSIDRGQLLGAERQLPQGSHILA